VITLIGVPSICARIARSLSAYSISGPSVDCSATISGSNGVRDSHRQRRGPDLCHGVRRECVATPHDAIVRRDAISLSWSSVDHLAGAELFDLEVDVEQIQLVEKARA
jgi:hypothetical protein